MKRLLFFIFLFLFGSIVQSQIVNIESYRLKKDTNNFFGSVNGHFSANQNQKSIIQIGANSNLEYWRKRHTFMWIGIFNWVKTTDNNVKTTYINEGFQHFRYNYLLSKDIKLESYVQYQYNKVMNLKERDLLGCGLRFKLSDKLIKTYVGSAIMFERDITYDDIRISSFKSSDYISVSIYVGNNLKLSNTTYFQFNLDTYRAYTVFESTINIYKRIYYKISFILQYDNQQIYHCPRLTYNTVHNISITF